MYILYMKDCDDMNIQLKSKKKIVLSRINAFDLNHYKDYLQIIKKPTKEKIYLMTLKAEKYDKHLKKTSNE